MATRRGQRAPISPVRDLKACLSFSFDVRAEPATGGRDGLPSAGGSDRLGGKPSRQLSRCVDCVDVDEPRREDAGEQKRHPPAGPRNRR